MCVQVCDVSTADSWQTRSSRPCDDHGRTQLWVSMISTNKSIFIQTSLSPVSIPFPLPRPPNLSLCLPPIFDLQRPQPTRSMDRKRHPQSTRPPGQSETLPLHTLISCYPSRLLSSTDGAASAPLSLSTCLDTGAMRFLLHRPSSFSNLPVVPLHLFPVPYVDSLFFGPASCTFTSSVAGFDWTIQISTLFCKFIFLSSILVFSYMSAPVAPVCMPILLAFPSRRVFCIRAWASEAKCST